MSKSLIQIVTEKHELERFIIECEGELDPVLEKVQAELSTDLENKAEKYCHYLEHIKHTAEFWKNKSDQYSQVASSLHKVSDRIKDLLKMGMQSLEIKTLESEDFKITTSQTKGRLVITNEAEVPSKYKMQVTTLVIDKELLRKDLDEGVEIPGAKIEPGMALRYTPNRGTK